MHSIYLSKVFLPHWILLSLILHTFYLKFYLLYLILSSFPLPVRIPLLQLLLLLHLSFCQTLSMFLRWNLILLLSIRPRWKNQLVLLTHHLLLPGLSFYIWWFFQIKIIHQCVPWSYILAGTRWTKTLIPYLLDKLLLMVLFLHTLI